MHYAQTGFSLEVDLSRGNIEKVAVDPKLADQFLGGQGSAAKTIWDRVQPEMDPLSPGNLLVFSVGLLAGTPVPGANRTSICSINPLTNQFVNSGVAGFFGPELKYAGYDSIVIRGKADGLVYLWINNDKVEIRDAEHLRGKSALETAALIQAELKGSKIQIAAIGLAGENLVSQATIDHANTSASRGVGVVMGDKRLKAIAVRGSREVAVAKPAELFAHCSRLYQELYDNPHCGDVFLSERDDAWHVRNHAWDDEDGRVKGFWTKELNEEWSVRVESEHVSYQWENYSQEMEEVHETIVDESEWLRGTGCYNCTKDCHQAMSLPGKRSYFLKSYVKLAYSMAACENLKLNYDVLFDLQQYGIDESSLPPLLSFVDQLHEAGILTPDDLPEFPSDPIGRARYLTKMIARREGVGNALADGIHQAARTIGRGAEAYDHTGGKPEQVSITHALAAYPYYLMYAAGEKLNITQIEGSFPQLPIPDWQEREQFVKGWEAAPERFKKWFLEWEEGKSLSVDAAVDIADWNEAMHYMDESLGVCPLLSSFRGQFGGRPPYHLNNLPELTSLATGYEIDTAGLLESAARSRNLVRAINVRRGLRREHDRVPDDISVGLEPREQSDLLDAYYAFKGWNSDGIPTSETLGRLGLEFVNDDFAKRGVREVAP